MSDLKRFSLVKPTIKTPLYIDFEWWKEHDSNWRVHLMSCLCGEHQASLDAMNGAAWIDWPDPVTAEIHQVDGLQHVLMTHCAKQEGFVSTNTTLVDAIFRVLLANGNTPSSSEELSIITGRPAEKIMLTLTGNQVYKGIRPKP
jgi:hypothetical protein